MSRAIVTSRLTWEGSASEPTHIVVGQIPFFAGCFMEGLSSSLDTGQQPPSVFSTWASLTLAAFFFKASSQKTTRKSVCVSIRQNTEVTITYNLITDVTSHHSGHTLFTRKKSLGPAHIQGSRVPKGLTTRRQGPLRCCLLWNIGY